MVHAYRVTLTVLAAIDTESTEFQALLEQRRAQLQAQIALYGGDPLPSEGVNAQLDDHAIIVLWRSHVGPERGDFIATIQAFTDQFTTIANWQVEHHICGNGRRKPCGAWQTILENK